MKGFYYEYVPFMICTGNTSLDNLIEPTKQIRDYTFLAGADMELASKEILMMTLGATLTECGLKFSDS